LLSSKHHPNIFFIEPIWFIRNSDETLEDGEDEDGDQ